MEKEISLLEKIAEYSHRYFAYKIGSKTHWAVVSGVCLVNDIGRGQQQRNRNPEEEEVAVYALNLNIFE